MRLNNKIAIVTGAARGIGFQIAKRYAEEGAIVVMADISDVGADSAMELKKLGLNVEFFQTDVSNNDSVEALVNHTIERYGRITTLVNNAAISIPGSILEITKEQWDKTFAVNVTSQFLLSRAVVPHMLKYNDGSIINMGSANSFVAQPRLASYVPTKGAITMLSKQMALDFSPLGIRVNTICPGWVDTTLDDPHCDLYGGKEKVKEGIADMHPIGRIIEPVEVANVAVFLASDEASAVTGSDYAVDGGYMAK